MVIIFAPAGIFFELIEFDSVFPDFFSKIIDMGSKKIPIGANIAAKYFSRKQLRF